MLREVGVIRTFLAYYSFPIPRHAFLVTVVQILRVYASTGRSLRLSFLVLALNVYPLFILFVSVLHMVELLSEVLKTCPQYTRVKMTCVPVPIPNDGYTNELNLSVRFNAMYVVQILFFSWDKLTNE